MSKSPSPEQTARLERQRIAAEDGSKALQEVANRAIAVRENMARLRSLRLAQEAQDTRAQLLADGRAAQVKPKKRSR